MADTLDRLPRQIRLSDFTVKEQKGTTSSSANTSAIFQHNSNARPTFWMVQEGAVYIPQDGVGANTIDVRSTKTSEYFRILLFY